MLNIQRKQLQLGSFEVKSHSSLDFRASLPEAGDQYHCSISTPALLGFVFPPVSRKKYQILEFWENMSDAELSVKF